MRYKTILILLALALTSCSHPGQEVPDGSIARQTDEQWDSSEVCQEEEETQEASQETEAEGSKGQAVQSDLQRIIDAEYARREFSEIPAGDFTDMQYLFLIQEEVGRFDDAGTPWYEYALLGSSYDTYEKGVNCYEDVNRQFEKYQRTILFDEFKEQNGEGFMKEYWRRHIVAFSPEADRILLVTYINPPYGLTALYDIYDNGSISIPLYWNSYVYPLTLFFRDINYTRALKYATLSHVVSIGEIYPFYNIAGLSNYDYSLQEKTPYYISRTTNADDTLYYKADMDSNGNKCIGIYSVADNRLVYQSEAVEWYPKTVDILDDKLIVSFGVHGYRYFEINMETNQVEYLFTTSRIGSASPDGKYLAYPFRGDEYRGYRIYSLETKEIAFIRSYRTDTELSEYSSNNIVLCWVNKDKIEELK